MIDNTREKNTLLYALATPLLVAIAFTLLWGLLNHINFDFTPITGTILNRIIIGSEMFLNAFIQLIKWYSFYCGAACILTFFLVLRFRKCFK